MSYKDLKLEDLRLKFGITNQIGKLFSNITPIEPNEILKSILETNKKLPMRTEKAKSEFIVAPILVDLKRTNDDFFTLYSGEILNADSQSGLIGECDFLITKNTNTFEISSPIFSVVEAKKNDTELGIHQCAAQMVGIKAFNEKNSNPVNIIYGCVTTADDWRFLKLENNCITVDDETYYFKELNKILGVFQAILDSYKNSSA